MFLKSAKHTLPTQAHLQRILKGVRGEGNKHLSEEDVEFLCNFHLDQTLFKEDFKTQVEEEALHLFATKEKMREHNHAKLLKLHSQKTLLQK